MDPRNETPTEDDRDAAYADAPVCPVHEATVNVYLCCPVCWWDSTRGDERC